MPITNRPPKPTAEGLQTGLIYDRHENDQGDKGVLISGTVAPGDFTVDSGEFTVNAPYAGGPVSRTFQHDIGKATLYALRATNPQIMHEFRINGDGEEISSVRSFTMNRRGTAGIDVDINYIYFKTIVGNNFYRTSRHTATGTTSTDEHVGNASAYSRGVAIDNGILYGVVTNPDIVYVVDTSDGTRLRVPRLPSTISFPWACVIDGNNLIIYDSTDRALYWIDKNTGDGVTATISKTVRLNASKSYNDLTLLGDRILIVNDTDDQIEAIDKNTGNNQIAEVLETYLIPSSFQSMTGIAIYTE